MTAPTWTVLIPTIGQRRDLFARLIDRLMPQVHAATGVDVLACWDNGEASLGHKRQSLVEAASGEYLCFVDDDDMVSTDYVSSIVDALETRPDYVGFGVDTYRDGRFYAPGKHDLTCGGWFTAPDGLLCRDITPRNPMPAQVARLANFRQTPRGGSEDTPWADAIRATGRLQRQVMIDRVLYDYLWVPSGTVWDDPDRKVRPVDKQGQPWERLDVDSPHFAWLEV